MLFRIPRKSPLCRRIFNENLCRKDILAFARWYLESCGEEPISSIDLREYQS
ncbi:hypothetical protein TAMC210_01570 [Thermanaeromonas sp. C210]|nr:hypothetical protein TAMC210_01570 [Thermanaeromonas sp. C210]